MTFSIWHLRAIIYCVLTVCQELPREFNHRLSHLTLKTSNEVDTFITQFYRRGAWGSGKLSYFPQVIDREWESWDLNPSSPTLPWHHLVSHKPFLPSSETKALPSPRKMHYRSQMTHFTSSIGSASSLTWPAASALFSTSILHNLTQIPPSPCQSIPHRKPSPLNSCKTFI